MKTRMKTRKRKPTPAPWDVEVQTCAMEASVCPVIGGFVRRWNDGIADSAEGDARRTAIFTPDLLDMLPGTKMSDEVMLRRLWMSIDWDLRTRTPVFLRLAKLDACAIALESLPEIRSQAGVAAGDAAGDAAWAAAWDAAQAAAGAAAGDAAWDAAWAAAGDAAWDAAVAAAWDAARAAAGDAARAAAWDAARAAAGAAAWDAAWDALKPTVEATQASARDLLVRMCSTRSGR
jgi:hypothetical protein